MEKKLNEGSENGNKSSKSCSEQFSFRVLAIPYELSSYHCNVSFQTKLVFTSCRAGSQALILLLPNFLDSVVSWLVFPWQTVAR